ncbi:uncharacterized protein LOC117177260 isoform X2 [Belonocnema kinseyi]|uniref:uncharacterized protein LOC117177260 isoform X2 n=1 Tax=Belonocnema kinseyi TaxID=2817044 RepID=UPI00143D2651|nr:uncharacterized protein LOC117177260 isoform X2 [Belonocnema kinseyi]
MSDKILLQFSLVLLVLALLVQEEVEAKKVIIHVPYHVKNLKHTHTIYKIIPHHEKKTEEHSFVDGQNYQYQK